MKITLGKIVNSVAALRKMASQDLSLKTAYEHSGYFDENRERICELADNQDKELEALLQTEVELADFQKVKVSLSEKVNMSALDLMELEEFIEFTE